MQRSSDNPLRMSHWLGVADSRPLALLRICLGAVLLQDLWARAGELGTFLSNEGLFPLGKMPPLPSWGLFHLTGAKGPITILFALGVIATACFTLGLWTRIATIATWVFFVSLHRRVGVIDTGGDSLADSLLFLGIFTDLSGRFSLDALRAGPRDEVRALVFRFMQYVPAVIYVFTVRQKLVEGGSTWYGGPILFQHMHLHGWIRPGGLWLREHPALCGFLATATIVTELMIPILLVLPFWIRPARALAVLGHIGLQVGILLTLKVGIFTNVMLAITMLWIPAYWIDRLGRRFARRETAQPVPPWTPARIALGAALSGMALLMVVTPILPSHLPRIVREAPRWVALDLKAGLFTRPYPSERWEAKGELADGTVVDPFVLAAPEANGTDGVTNSLWMQLPYRMADHAPLGRFVCQRYNARTTGPKLHAWTLTHLRRAPYGPTEAEPPEERRVLWHQECDEGARVLSGR